MFKNLLIKKIVAAAILFVFAISITPTIVFHNWLAGHTDTVKKPIETKGEQLGRKTYNCQCDHIVAESPFTEPAKEINPAAALPFSLIKEELQVHFISFQYYFYSLRGPPAV